MNELIDTIVSAIQDKKGKRILSLDLSGFDGAICSAFVVCSADSTTQVEAIAGGVEGLGNSVWVVMDYGDVMVHVFQTETRDFYKLEQLWADAPVREYAEEQ